MSTKLISNLLKFGIFVLSLSFWIVACNNSEQGNISLSIEYPLTNTKFKVGDTVNFKAKIIEGNISSDNLFWEVTLHHAGHEHPNEFEFKGLEGNWIFPDHGDDTYSELCLSLLNDGQKDNTECVKLYHEEVQYSFDSVPSGLELSYNASTYTTPFTVQTYVNGLRTISAASTQQEYLFDSWSIGGSAKQDIRIAPKTQDIKLYYSSPIPNSTKPEITILTPTANDLFGVGDPLNLSATVLDKEDGELRGSQLQWSILLHEKNTEDSSSRYEVFQSSGSSTNWTIPDHKDGSYFEACLRATDSSQTTTRECFNLKNNEVKYSFDSEPQGLKLSYENQTYETPFEITSILNAQRNIFAPSPQSNFSFNAWSNITNSTNGANGGQQKQSISMSKKTDKIVATFLTGNEELTEEVFISLPNTMTPVSIEWGDNSNLLYIADKLGLIWIVENGTLLEEPFIDISREVNHFSARGLLSFALHPDFPQQPFVYLLYTYDPPEVFEHGNDRNARADGLGQRVVRLVRYTADENTNYKTAVANSAKILVGENSNWATTGNPFEEGKNLTDQWACYENNAHIPDCIPQEDADHTTGSVLFDNSGNLLFSVGDATSSSKAYDLANRVFDLDSFAGKLMRINPDNGEGLATNPFFDGDLNSTQSKIYAYGLRNPYTFTLDPQTDEPYIGDVGWNQWEEINRGGGNNFGWPCFEGGNGNLVKTPTYKDSEFCTNVYLNTTVEPALLAWPHKGSAGNAAIVGEFYTASNYPEKYHDALFYGDYATKELSVMLFNGDSISTEYFTTLSFAPSDIKLGPDGNLYLVDIINDRIIRLVYKNLQ